MPVMGYLIAFIYESRYLSVYGIPSDFVIINWTNLIVASGSVLGISIALLIFLWLPLIAAIFGASMKNILFGIIIRQISMYTYTTIFFARYHMMESGLEFVFILPVFLTFLDFIFPLITQRKVRGYSNKLKTQDKIDREKASFLKLPAVISRHIVIIIVVMVTVTIILTMGYMEGKRNALTREEYLVPSTYPESVVVRVYQDYLICTQFNQEPDSNERTFFLISIDEEPDFNLSLQEMNPLIQN